MAEIIVLTPMFLPNVSSYMLDIAAHELMTQIGNLGPGERIEAETVGITKDSDGWPMKRWCVRHVKGN